MIVDDHPIVRRGLALTISQEPDLEVCGEAANVTEALQKVEERHPDIVVIDISLDGEDGIELIDYVKSRWPAVKILVCSAHDEETFAGRVLRAGARGYVSKREAIAKIVEAIRQVLLGEIYLSPRMATSLLQRASIGEPLDRNPVETLSNRELQVFDMIGQGLNTTQIAEKLQLSPKTIESHRKLIKMKLKLQTSPSWPAAHSPGSKRTSSRREGGKSFPLFGVVQIPGGALRHLGIRAFLPSHYSDSVDAIGISVLCTELSIGGPRKPAVTRERSKPCIRRI